MKKTIATLVAAAALSSLTGCASLTQAGHSGTELKTIQDKNGKPVGCDLKLADGKEYASRSVSLIAVNGAGCDFTMTETGVKAFRGQATAVKGLSLFPVTDLQDLLGGDGK